MGDEQATRGSHRSSETKSKVAHLAAQWRAAVGAIGDDRFGREIELFELSLDEFSDGGFAAAGAGQGQKLH
jgi:hypothetical protein